MEARTFELRVDDHDWSGRDKDGNIICARCGKKWKQDAPSKCRKVKGGSNGR